MTDVDDDLMCQAHGCPNHWSSQVGSGPKLCRWHQFTDPHMWPRITDEQLQAQTERIRRAALKAVNPPEPVPPLTVAEKRALMEQARTIGQMPHDPLYGAKMLRDAELNNDGINPNTGHRLTQLQRDYWRRVLAKPQERDPDEVLRTEDELRRTRERIEQNLHGEQK